MAIAMTTPTALLIMLVIVWGAMLMTGQALNISMRMRMVLMMAKMVTVGWRRQWQRPTSDNRRTVGGARTHRNGHGAEQTRHV